MCVGRWGVSTHAEPLSLLRLCTGQEQRQRLGPEMGMHPWRDGVLQRGLHPGLLRQEGAALPWERSGEGQGWRGLLS